MNSKIFETENIKFYYKDNKSQELNPLIELYRAKLYLSIVKVFINTCIKNFGTKIFSLKKSCPRTLTNLLSSWLFNLYSTYDFEGDCFLPSNFNNTDCIRNTINDYAKSDTNINDVESKINFVIGELKNIYNINLNLLNSYKVSDYYKKNKHKYKISKILYTNSNKIVFYKLNMQYFFKIRDKKLFNLIDNIIIPIDVYKCCKNKYNGPENKFDIYLWIIIFRYQLLGSNNHQLGVLPKILNKMKEDFNLEFECFASSINSIFSNYCSVYNDVEKYFNSRGSFFNLNPIYGTYSFNPPYQSDVINKGINKLFIFLKNADKSKNILNFIITIPIWDIEGKNIMNENQSNNIDYGEFMIINKIKESKYFKGLRMISKENFTYLDHNFHLYKNITIQNTYVIVLSSDPNNNFIEKINKYKFTIEQSIEI